MWVGRLSDLTGNTEIADGSPTEAEMSDDEVCGGPGSVPRLVGSRLVLSREMIMGSRRTKERPGESPNPSQKRLTHLDIPISLHPFFLSSPAVS